MSLHDLQRRVFEVVSTPLTPSEHIQQRTRQGNSSKAIAEEIIKPNDRLTSLERLELYNRQYWWRLLGSLSDDFPGLRAVVGQRKFDRLSSAYLCDCPSQSFTLRNLGSKLEAWLREHPEFTHPRESLALDMVRLEWAEIETFDGAERRPLSAMELARLDPDSTLALQPHLRLLDLHYPVDTMLLAIRKQNDSIHDETSNAVSGNHAEVSSPRIKTAKRSPVFLAVHRSDLVVYFKRLDAEAFALLAALQQGKTLSESIELAFQDSERSESEMASLARSWFELWTSWGWFCKSEEEAAA